MALNLKTCPVTFNNLFNELYLLQWIKGLLSTLLTVATTISALLFSKLISPNGKVTHLLVTNFENVKQELWIVKQKPWNQWSKPKWAKDMERVERSAGFDENGVWNQMSSYEFARMTFTLFWTQIFQSFSTCFIHHEATMLSLQQNMDDTVTTWLMPSSKETNNQDNSKQDRSSNRGMVCDFDGTNRHLLATKFTVTPWRQRLKM